MNKKKKVKQLNAFICILLKGKSVYFILEFLKALQKSLELRIFHTSSEDVADNEVGLPRIVMVVLPPFSIL